MTDENKTEGQEAFDVSQFELEDVAVLTVQNAAGTGDLLYGGKPVTIELYGPGSPQAVKADHKAGRAEAARLKRVMGGKMAKDEAEQADAEQVERLVARTRAINNFPIPGGAQAIYSNQRLGYIKRQVQRFLAEEANFAKASSES